LSSSLCRHGEWLHQGRDLAQLVGDWVHVFFVVDDVLRHEAVLLLDATFSEISGKAEILSVRAARNAVIMRARSPNHWNDDIAKFHSRNFRSNFYDFPQ